MANSQYSFGIRSCYLENIRFGKFSIRLTTNNYVHDVISCIEPENYWTVPKQKYMYTEMDWVLAWSHRSVEEHTCLECNGSRVRILGDIAISPLRFT